MRIVSWKTILMQYHTLFLSKIERDVAKFVVCCSRDWCFKALLINAAGSLKMMMEEEPQNHTLRILRSELCLPRETSLTDLWTNIESIKNPQV